MFKFLASLLGNDNDDEDYAVEDSVDSLPHSKSPERGIGNGKFADTIASLTNSANPGKWFTSVTKLFTF